MKLSEGVRAAIRASGWSRYRLSKETGIAQSVLSRFEAGAGITTDTLDKIAEVLRLRLAGGARPKAAAAPKARKRG